MSTANIDLQTVLVRAAELVHNELDGEVTMMNVQTGKYYGLASPVAAEIWRLLENPVSVNDVCARLTSRFTVERARCEQDVLPFLQRMADEGVVIPLPTLTAT